MKRYQIRILPEAEEQLTAIRAWWRRNRREHPDLVREELAEAVRTLASFPVAGVEHRARGRGPMRKLLLPRSQYHVFYRVFADESAVEIFAVWRTSRGKGPPIP
jgi:plasmid stabilization system protein ParE